MRARELTLALCLFLTTSTITAKEEEIPPLELLGFIADFSDEEDGWVDPGEIEGLFNLESTDENSTDENSTDENGANKGKGTAIESSDFDTPQNDESRE